MNPIALSRLTAALAAERLDAYRRDGVPVDTAVARYLRNVALCEALYPPLQLAEVALRNAVHGSLRVRYASDLWFESAAVPMAEWQRLQVTKARQKLTDENKPVTAGRMIAELNFGFWTGFLNKHQARTGLGFHLARHAMAHAPREARDLAALDARWTKLRDLRNRVFHHERIVHFADLAEQHRLLHESIQWISPELQHLAASVDRFPAVHATGLDPWLEKIRQL